MIGFNLVSNFRAKKLLSRRFNHWLLDLLATVGVVAITLGECALALLGFILVQVHYLVYQAALKTARNLRVFLV